MQKFKSPTHLKLGFLPFPLPIRAEPAFGTRFAGLASTVGLSSNITLPLRLGHGENRGKREVD